MSCMAWFMSPAGVAEYSKSTTGFSRNVRDLLTSTVNSRQEIPGNELQARPLDSQMAGAKWRITRGIAERRKRSEARREQQESHHFIVLTNRGNCTDGTLGREGSDW